MRIAFPSLKASFETQHTSSQPVPVAPEEEQPHRHSGTRSSTAADVGADAGAGTGAGACDAAAPASAAGHRGCSTAVAVVFAATSAAGAGAGAFPSGRLEVASSAGVQDHRSRFQRDRGAERDTQPDKDRRRLRERRKWNGRGPTILHGAGHSGGFCAK